jgi:uncharacterized membrane protein YcaP (DUF421 family)
VLVFGYGLLALRLAGRRAFAKWSALDTIVAITIGSSLSRTLTGNADLLGTLAASSILLLLHWIVAKLAAHSDMASTLFEGAAVTLASAGHVVERCCKRHAVSRADLEEALRSAGIATIAGTSLVMLEPSGEITVLERVTTSDHA